MGQGQIQALVAKRLGGRGQRRKVSLDRTRTAGRLGRGNLGRLALAVGFPFASGACGLSHVPVFPSLARVSQAGGAEPDTSGP
eukprot:SAG31_NODE_27459_length_425_cov_2.601227_1_plen_82_part_10